MEGEPCDTHAARPEEYDDISRAFAEIVAMGEGFPHDPDVALTYDDFNDYWLDHKSFVGVATLGDRLAGSYHLKPNLVGRGAHIANAGYFVVRDLRGHGIGERLVRHSLQPASQLGFHPPPFHPLFAAHPAPRPFRPPRVPAHAPPPPRTERRR